MKKFRHLANLSALLLVLALATMGLVYGQWTETLSVNGTVRTGEVDVDWLSTFYGCWDNESLATIDASLSQDEDTITVTVQNGYPGYRGNCSSSSIVQGAIPVYIKSIDFTPGSNLTGCATVYSPNTGSFTATCQQMQVVWSNGLCREFLAGVGDGEGSQMYFTLLPNAEQATNYQFTVSYTYEQATGSNSCIYH